MYKIEQKAVDQLHKAEKTQFARAAAYIAIRGDIAVKIRVAYPKDGAGILRAWAWGENGICYGTARGYGYDKLSAALSAMDIGYGVKLADCHGGGWETAFVNAGFTVIHVL